MVASDIGGDVADGATQERGGEQLGGSCRGRQQLQHSLQQVPHRTDQATPREWNVLIWKKTN